MQHARPHALRCQNAAEPRSRDGRERSEALPDPASSAQHDDSEFAVRRVRCERSRATRVCWQAHLVHSAARCSAARRTAFEPRSGCRRASALRKPSVFARRAACARHRAGARTHHHTDGCGSRHAVRQDAHVPAEARCAWQVSRHRLLLRNLPGALPQSPCAQGWRLLEPAFGVTGPAICLFGASRLLHTVVSFPSDACQATRRAQQTPVAAVIHVRVCSS